MCQGSTRTFRLAGPDVWNARPAAVGGSICVGVRSAATSVAAMLLPLSTRAGMLASRTINGFALMSPVKTGSTATPTSCSMKGPSLPRRSTIRSNSPRPVPKVVCPVTGSHTCTHDMP